MKVCKKLAVLSLCLFVLASSAGAQQVIGYTTDLAAPHLDDYTLEGVEREEAAADLINDGYTLVEVQDFTLAGLAGIDMLVFGPMSPDHTPSSAQVDVLENFVLSGGKLVFFGDNQYHWHDSNVAVGGRFGIQYPTVDPVSLTASNVPLPRHPIMDGPFGEVNVLDGTTQSPAFFGSMSDPGPHGSSLIDFDNGYSAAVVIERGALGPGSGVVIAYGDMDLFSDGDYDRGDHRAMWRNTFAYVPEPATLSLLAVGAVGVLGKRRRE